MTHRKPNAQVVREITSELPFEAIGSHLDVAQLPAHIRWYRIIRDVERFRYQYGDLLLTPVYKAIWAQDLHRTIREYRIAVERYQAGLGVKNIGRPRKAS